MRRASTRAIVLAGVLALLAAAPAQAGMCGGAPHHRKAWRLMRVTTGHEVPVPLFAMLMPPEPRRHARDRRLPAGLFSPLPPALFPPSHFQEAGWKPTVPGAVITVS